LRNALPIGRTNRAAGGDRHPERRCHPERSEGSWSGARNVRYANNDQTRANRRDAEVGLRTSRAAADVDRLCPDPLGKVAYLATDAKRLAAFRALEQRVGLTPADILSAKRNELEAVCAFGGAVGIAERAKSMHDSAALVLDEFDGDLYTRMYRSVAEASRAELVDDFAWLTDAHVYLRHHGQELCKTSAPRCEACAVRAECSFGSRHKSKQNARL